MNDNQTPPRPKPSTREERLAARLRDNLKLRKAQSRALNDVAERALEQAERDSQG